MDRNRIKKIIPVLCGLRTKPLLSPSYLVSYRLSHLLKIRFFTEPGAKYLEAASM